MRVTINAGWYYARHQWLTAADTEQRQLRAYVGVAAGDVQGLGTDQQKFTMVRKNYGQTPAYNVGFSEVGVATVDANQVFVPQPRACIALPGAPLSLFTIFPTGESRFTFSGKATLSEAQIQAIKNGSPWLIYYGSVCYKDAFEHSHVTNYCWMFNGQSTTKDDAEGCLPHNDSD